MAAQTALDLETLLQQRGLHMFNLDLGDKHQCLITSVDSFVSDVRPLLTESKPKLRTALAVALQEIAAEQVNLHVGTDYDLCEPSVTLLTVSEFLELVEDEGMEWTCANESGRAAVQTVLDAKRMQLVAPGHSLKRIFLDPQAEGVEELFKSIFVQLAQPGTLGTEIDFAFDAQGRLLSATDVFEGIHQFAQDDVPTPVHFRAKAILDVANLEIYSEHGTQLCEATLATASEFTDADYLSAKLFDLYFGEGMFGQLTEPIELPVGRWVPVE